MSEPGRLAATISPRIQRIVYGRPASAELADELRWTTTVDLAHLVMLVEQDLVAASDAAALLSQIGRLRADDFRPLHDLPTPRGLYLAYEDHLIAALGAEIGGRLHTGRSRNDLKATTTAMRLRARLIELVGALARLQAVLLARARAYHDTVMPIYTHHQAALPVTYGYYLAGVALAIGRDSAALLAAAGGLRRCPLGAGAVAGSDLPIDSRRTAGLLGFCEPPQHALDAVASRDVALRALAAAAGAALTVSRLATDLQLWSTVEFDFVDFPDRLVGGSSAMPQKRNVFLLEHVKAKAGVAIGAWTAAASMIRSTPFTNCIEVSTEAMAAVWPGLQAVADGVLLAQALVRGARPVPERMRQRAEDGFVGASALANRLVRRGTPFRTAHHLVGAAVRRAVERGATRLAADDLPPELRATDLSLSALVAQQRIGGPGDLAALLETARGDVAEHVAWCRSMRSRLAAAERALAAAVAGVVERGGAR